MRSGHRIGVETGELINTADFTQMTGSPTVNVKAVVFAFATVVIIGLLAKTIRNSYKGKAGTYDPVGIFVIFSTALYFIAATCVSVFVPGFLYPFWFEDVLLVDLVTLLTALFFILTGKLAVKETVFAGFSVVLSVLIAFTISEAVLRIATPEFNPGGSGGAFTTRQFPRIRNSIIKPIPPDDVLRRLHDLKVPLSDYFDVKDHHVFPSPDKAKGEKRVLLLGDSMTEGAGVEHANRFSNLLENKTGVSHFNFALAGASTDYQMLVLERFFDVIKPDLVVLGFFPANDCSEFGNIHTEHPFYYKPLLKMVDGRLEQNSFSRMELLFYDVASMPPAGLIQLACRYTATGKMINNIRTKMIYYIGEELILNDYAKNNGINFVETDNFNPAGVCKALKRMDDVVRQKGSDFLVLGIPYLAEKSNKDNIINLNKRWRSGECRIETDKCLSEMKLNYKDGSGIFSKEIEIEDIESVLINDKVHFNEGGHKKIAEYLEPIELEALSKSR